MIYNLKNILIIFIVFLVIPLSNAGLSDTGEGIIANGMEKFFVKIGDSCFAMSFQLDGYNSERDDNVSTAIFQMATLTFNPFESSIVQDIQKSCAVMFLFIAVLLIFVYGIQAILAFYRPQWSQGLNYVTGQAAMSPIPEFISKIVSLFGVILLVDFLILLTLVINYVLCNMIMVDVMNHIAIAPDNVLFYLCFGILYFVMNMFYVYRAMIICVVAAYGLLIGALYIIEATKWIAVTIFSYFIVMTFMQFIIAAVCAVIIPLIEGGFALLPDGILGTAIEYGPGGFFYIIAYFVLLVIIFCIAMICVLSPVIVMVSMFLFRKTMKGFF